MKSVKIKQPTVKIYLRGKRFPLSPVFPSAEKVKEFQRQLLECEKVICDPLFLTVSEIRFISFC